MLDFTRYVAGLLLVLGILAGFAFILRRGQLQGLIPGMPGAKSDRRMRVVESLMLDPRRRILIVEIDEHEHVLLLGSERETRLSTGPAQPRFTPETPEDEDEADLRAGDAS